MFRNKLKVSYYEVRDCKSNGCSDQSGNVSGVDQQGFRPVHLLLCEAVLLSYGGLLPWGKALLTLADVPVYQAVPAMSILFRSS